MGGLLWRCPRCGVTQDPDEIKTIEILEPGRESRVEYHGRIRPNSSTAIAVYFCLVCDHQWIGTSPDPEDPTPPGGASASFPHPIYESGDGDFDGLTEWGRERDAC